MSVTVQGCAVKRGLSVLLFLLLEGQYGWDTPLPSTVGTGPHLLEDPPVLPAGLQPSGQWSPGALGGLVPPVWMPLCGNVPSHSCPPARFLAGSEREEAAGPNFEEF